MCIIKAKNWMLSLSPLKKFLKNLPKRSYRPNTFVYSNKSQKLHFSGTFSLITFFAWVFLQLMQLFQQIRNQHQILRFWYRKTKNVQYFANAPVFELKFAKLLKSWYPNIQIQKNYVLMHKHVGLHCNKSLTISPSRAGTSLTKLSLAGNK